MNFEDSKEEAAFRERARGLAGRQRREKAPPQGSLAAQGQRQRRRFKRGQKVAGHASGKRLGLPALAKGIRRHGRQSKSRG